MNTRQLGILLRSFSVRRYHTLPVINDQTVGDHTARVLAIALHLGTNTGALVRAILEHDGLESLTGDIPATAKWRGNFGELVEKLEEDYNKDVGFHAYEYLTQEEKLLLKVADMTELCLWTQAEMIMGNSFLQGVHQRGIRYLEGLREKMPEGMWEAILSLLGLGSAKAANTPAPTPNVQAVTGGPDHAQS